MSKQSAGTSGQVVRIDMVHAPNRAIEYRSNTQHQNCRVPKTSKSDFAYINTAYVGSTNSVNDTRLPQPPVSVMREQYWACSKWPFATRFLVITVSVLIGAVIGLSVLVVLRGDNKDVTDLFRTHPAPD
ncbi:uncharacterized protein LOC120637036 [Pararge aegeria]|uniref:Jg14063 protein n=1 Tax=Pararge aegeria aegeria TaxID=348720 RepID=A0A8S4SQT9_9NEOP|nr:uncharacterized protein LOC120637036 [Pararge aegeria]CAH2269355.1 jg14063 [Pararge aegeria aegeria]